MQKLGKLGMQNVRHRNVVHHGVQLLLIVSMLFHTLVLVYSHHYMSGKWLAIGYQAVLSCT